MTGTNITVQPAPKTAYLTFSAEIVVGTTESLLATASNLVQGGFDRMHLLLSTPGGSVMHGMNIYNVLRGLPMEIVTHNAGNVDSIGNMIFQAGKMRYACPHSTFMFHGVGMDLAQPKRLEEKFMKEALESIRADQTNSTGMAWARPLRSTNASTGVLVRVPRPRWPFAPPLRGLPPT